MLGSIIERSPLLAGIVAAVVAVLVLLVVSAVISSRWGKRKAAPVVAAPQVRQEPVFGGELAEPRPQTVSYTRAQPYRDPVEELAEIEEVEEEEPLGPLRHRRRFGFAALSLAFLVGLGAGVGAMALSSSGQLNAMMRSFVALANTVLPAGEVDGGKTTVPNAKAAKPEKQDAGEALPLPSPESDGAGTGEVAERLAAFTDRLKESLPRDAGPELILTGVETSGMTVNLSYAVGRPVPKVEVSAFDAYVMRAIKSLFCGKDSRELRYLNENGVAFNMDYVDPTGETVAKLTVPADFCAQ